MKAIAQTNCNKLLPPAQLWIGSHKELCINAERFLKHQFCLNNGCDICTTCKLIRERQFHGAIWLYPEKRYTRDQIKIIFDTISFSLADDQHLFFIIQKADCLTTACSNSLLKSVEEPPPGYHFLFLAERKDLIIPTIRSRCTIYTYQQKTTEHDKEGILLFFKERGGDNPAEFSKLLMNLKPNEQESAELLDKLFIYWMNEAKKAVKEKNGIRFKEIESKLAVIKKALLKPPMPGSSAVFWKNLYLQFYP